MCRPSFLNWNAACYSIFSSVFFPRAVVMVENDSSTIKRKHFSPEEDKKMISVLANTKGNLNDAMEELMALTRRKKNSIIQHIKTKNFASLLNDKNITLVTVGDREKAEFAGHVARSRNALSLSEPPQKKQRLDELPDCSSYAVLSEEEEDEAEEEAFDDYPENHYLLEEAEHIAFKHSSLTRPKLTMDLETIATPTRPHVFVTERSPLYIYFRKPIDVEISRDSDQNMITINIIAPRVTVKELEELEKCNSSFAMTEGEKKYFEDSEGYKDLVEIVAKIPKPYQTILAQKLETEHFIGVMVPKVESNALL